MTYGDQYYTARGITEDSAAPSRSVGTLISALTDSRGSLNKFADGDCKIRKQTTSQNLSRNECKTESFYAMLENYLHSRNENQ